MNKHQLKNGVKIFLVVQERLRIGNINQLKNKLQVKKEKAKKHFIDLLENQTLSQDWGIQFIKNRKYEIELIGFKCTLKKIQQQMKQNIYMPIYLFIKRYRTKNKKNIQKINSEYLLLQNKNREERYYCRKNQLNTQLESNTINTCDITQTKNKLSSQLIKYIKYIENLQDSQFKSNRKRIKKRKRNQQEVILKKSNLIIKYLTLKEMLNKNQFNKQLYFQFKSLQVLQQQRKFIVGQLLAILKLLNFTLDKILAKFQLKILIQSVGFYIIKFDFCEPHTTIQYLAELNIFKLNTPSISNLELSQKKCHQKPEQLLIYLKECHKLQSMLLIANLEMLVLEKV
ncbi:unnamed protein product [Paramecium octaurelia]|uniref:Uncharacterized protein n=1 Tax=Paramecium octaurelia TaxID=43137 RepID=A0A8S1YQ22_PAROT|nr:unnamed protein product [Paramecium octaurelia]